MAKTDSQAPDAGRSAPEPGIEDQTLKLLREFSRESRRAGKRPIKPPFGHRYLTPRSD